MTEPHYIIRMLWSIKLLVDIYATHFLSKKYSLFEIQSLKYGNNYWYVENTRVMINILKELICSLFVNS